MLEIKNTTKVNQTIIYISGRIDSSNADIFKDEISKVSVVGDLVFDIENLEYISSAGLRVLLNTRKDHPGLQIINASREVFEILEMTGFTEMMKVVKAYKKVSVEGCEIIGQGANGAVYRIDNDTVVKVYLNPESLEDIEHERSVARKALVLGIPTAISYDVVKVDDHYASMFELINAQSFSKLLNTNPDKLDLYCHMYVDLLKQIHSTVVPKGDLPDQKDITLNWCDIVKPYLTDEQYKKIVKLIKEIPYDDHMIHGDYHTKNLMLQNNEVILIDMDTLAVGHPVLEFASMYNAFIGFSYFNHDAIKTFLGFDHEIGEEFWHKSVQYYYDSKNQDFLQRKENQAATVGLLRIFRRAITKKLQEDTILAYRDLFVKYLETVDSLID